MRKAIVICDDTSYKQIQKYSGYPYLVIASHNNEVKTDARFSDFKIDDEDVVTIDDPHRVILSSKNSNENTSNIEDAINTISKQFTNTNNNSALIIVLVSVGAILVIASVITILLKRKKHIA